MCVAAGSESVFTLQCCAFKIKLTLKRRDVTDVKHDINISMLTIRAEM